MDISAELLPANGGGAAAAVPGLAIPLVAPTSRGCALARASRRCGARRLDLLSGSTIGNHRSRRRDGPVAARGAPGRSRRHAHPRRRRDLGPSLLLPAYDDPQGRDRGLQSESVGAHESRTRRRLRRRGLRHAARFDAPTARRDAPGEPARAVGPRGRRALPLRQGESIHTQSSYKLGVLRIQAMAAGAGWTQRQMWTDAHARFGARFRAHGLTHRGGRQQMIVSGFVAALCVAAMGFRHPARRHLQRRGDRGMARDAPRAAVDGDARSVALGRRRSGAGSPRAPGGQHAGQLRQAGRWAVAGGALLGVGAWVNAPASSVRWRAWGRANGPTSPRRWASSSAA